MVITINLSSNLKQNRQAILLTTCVKIWCQWTENTESLMTIHSVERLHANSFINPSLWELFAQYSVWGFPNPPRPSVHTSHRVRTNTVCHKDIRDYKTLLQINYWSYNCLYWWNQFKIKKEVKQSFTSKNFQYVLLNYFPTVNLAVVLKSGFILH